MTDIVKRLRAEAPTIFTEGHNIDDFDAIDAQREEAAAEITALRAENERLRGERDRQYDMNVSLIAENQKLRVECGHTDNE